ncbi:MAG: hypothetical protein NC311_11475, partial [Muribaculaceae bacterium]|nr:hypothetical protein [Muribaculaceae bacterium]
LVRQERELYGEDSVIQYAQINPTIDQSGSTLYTAYFGVHMKDAEDLHVHGMAYFMGTATMPEVPDDDTNDQEPSEPDDGEKPETPADLDNANKEPENNNKDDASLSAGKTVVEVGKNEITDAMLRADEKTSFNLNSRGPMKTADDIYHVRIFEDDPGAIDYDVASIFSYQLSQAGRDASKKIYYSVLDQRLATIDAKGVITPVIDPETGHGREGRTAVYAMSFDENSDPVYAVLQLEVRSRFYLSSGQALSNDPNDAYAAKVAVPMVSAGDSHSLAVKADGSVYGWGNSPTGTYTLGSANGSSSSPVPIYQRSSSGIYTPLTNIVMVAAGVNTSLALTADGFVYAWGSNVRGQTGTGFDADQSPSIADPTLVVAASADDANNVNGYLGNIVSIVACGTHSMALAADGRVYAWGEAEYGQLGVLSSDSRLSSVAEKDQNGNATNVYIKYSPRPIVVQTTDASGALTELTGVIAIAGGGASSVALCYDGTVWTWGDNRRGQLGANQDRERLANRGNAQKVTQYHYYLKDAENGERTEDGFGGVVAIAAGGQTATSNSSASHVLAIKAVLEDGLDSTTVYGWGADGYGQTGTNDDPPKNMNEVTSVQQLLPTEVRYDGSYKDSSGNYYIGRRTVAVAAGDTHSLAIVLQHPQDAEDESRDVYATYGWGYDDRGQLGLGSLSGNVSSSDGDSTGQQRVPIQMRKEDAASDADPSTIVHVLDSVGISAGGSYSIYWDAEGEVYGTGYNQAYQLGAAPTLATMTDRTGNPLAANTSVKVPVRVGNNISQNLIYDKVWVFTTTTDEDTGEVSTGLTARYAVQPETVPQEGDPGDADIAPNVANIPVSQLVQIDPTGDDENLMDLTDDQFQMLKSTSMEYTLTITDEQFVILFRSGMKRYYSVGFNISERDRAVPSDLNTDMIYGLTRTPEIPNLTVKTTGKDEVPIEPYGWNNAILTPTDMKDVSAIVGVVEDKELDPDEEPDPDGENSIYAGKMEINIADANNFATPMVCAGKDFTVALKSDGSVWAWGDNSYGQLGTGKTYEEMPYAPYPVRVVGMNKIMPRLTLIKEIAAGYHHALARTADGSVYAWGANDRGQLGQAEDIYKTYDVNGDTIKVEIDDELRGQMTQSICYPVQVWGDKDKSGYLMGVSDISANGDYSLAATSPEGYVYSWGDNSEAQLATGYVVSAIGDMRTFPERVVADTREKEPSKRYLTHAETVIAGPYHAAALGQFPYAKDGGTSTSNSVYVAVWGDNSHGQLGLGPERSTPDSDGMLRSYAVDYVRRRNTQGDPDVLDSVIAVAAGRYHTVMLTSGGNVYVAGDATHGQLGTAAKDAVDGGGYLYLDYATRMTEPGRPNTAITDAVGVAAGEYYTILMRGKRAEVQGDSALGEIIESALYAFGKNTDGQLGVAALDSNGYYQESEVNGLATGAQAYLSIPYPDSIEGVVTSVAAGGAHVVALTNKNEVFAWGKNESGQLGEFSLVDRDSASQSGFDSAYIPVVSGVINYGGNLEYDVRVVTHQNGVLWSDTDGNDDPDVGYSEREYKLVLNTKAGTEYPLVQHNDGVAEDGSTYTYYSPDPRYTPTGNGKVPGGSYTVWARRPATGGSAAGPWENTGTVVKAIKAANFVEEPAVVNFFTVHFSIEDVNSSGSIIKATYQVGQDAPIELQNGQSVWGGGKLTILAQGQNGVVPNYAYDWDVTPTGTQYTPVIQSRYPDGETESERATMDALLTIETLTQEVTVKCVVTAPKEFDVLIRVMKDGSSWYDSGKSLYLKSQYKTIELIPDEADNFMYNAEAVPEGVYTIWEEDPASATAYESPNKVTVKGGDVNQALRYFTIDTEVLPTNGVASASLRVQYAKLDESGRYVINEKPEPLHNTLPVVAMENTLVYFEARGTVGVAFNRLSVTADWTNSAGSGDPAGLSLVEGTDSIKTGTASRVYKVTGRGDVKITLDGNGTDSDKSYMAIQLQLVDEYGDGENWDAYAAGYEFYLESQYRRSDSVTASQTGKVWASYKLSSRGGGLFDCYNANLPKDIYMVYALDTATGVKIPLLNTKFNLTDRGYLRTARTDGEKGDSITDPNVTPMPVTYYKVDYNFRVNDNRSSTGVDTAYGTEAVLQVINGFNATIQDPAYEEQEPGGDDSGEEPGEGEEPTVSAVMGKWMDGTLMLSDDPNPHLNVQVIKTIHGNAYTSGNLEGVLYLPVGNTISVQVVGGNAREAGFRVEIPIDADTKYEGEAAYAVSRSPVGTPVVFSTSEAASSDNLTKPNIDESTGDPDWIFHPWDIDAFRSFRVVVTGYGQPVAVASLMSVNKANTFAALERGPVQLAAALDEEESGSTGTGIVVETVVPGRELPDWSEKDPTMDELALGTYIELIYGDRVDIVGTTEKFVSDFRLTRTETSYSYYRNITPDKDGKVQPYITKPAAMIPGDEFDEVTGEAILVENPEYALWGNDVKLEITSSDPEVVSVDGYSLVAEKRSGKAVVRVYNPWTRHSTMLTVHVLNVTDATGEGLESEYAYQSTPMISLGDNFSVGLKADGTVWTWGDNTYGQLGVGTTTDLLPYCDTPMTVRTDEGMILRNVVAVAAGARHALALTRDGKVYAWGSDDFGELGIDPLSEKMVEVDSLGLPTGIIGTIVAVEVDTSAILGKITDLTAGDGFSIVLTERGTVWGWGRHDRGQLGIGYQGDVFGTDPVRDANLDLVSQNEYDIVTNMKYSVFYTLIGILEPDLLAKDENGDLRDGGVAIALRTQRFDKEVEGYFLDSYYLYAQYLVQLLEFVGTQENGLQSVESANSMYSKETGKLMYFLDEFRGNEMPTHETYVLAMELYNEVQKYLDKHPTVYNEELLYNTFKPVAEELSDDGSGAIQFREDWVLAKPTYSGVKWSYEDYVTALDAYHERIANGTYVTTGGQYSTGEGNPIYESAPDFELISWSPVQVLEGASASQGIYLNHIISVSAGKNHVMALRSDGSLYGWGDNTYGQLGVGLDSTVSRTDTLATRPQGTEGAIGATFTYRVPVRVRTTDARGSENGIYEDALSAQRAREMYGYLVNVVSVSAGGNHTVALLADGTAVAFGENTYGQVGDGNLDWITYDSAEVGMPVEEGSDELITVMDMVSDKIVTRRIATPQPVLARETGYNSIENEETGEVIREIIEVGELYRLSDIQAVAAGGNVSEAIVRKKGLTGDGKERSFTALYAWGSNMEGQLGLEEIRNADNGETMCTAFVGHAKQVMKGDSPNEDTEYAGFTDAMGIAVGGKHTAALRVDGYVWNWGDNNYGQLGNGTSDSSFWAVQVGDGESKSLILDKYEHYDANNNLIHTYDQKRPVGEDNPNVVNLYDGEYLIIDMKDLLYSYRKGFNLISDGSNDSIAHLLHLVESGVTDPSVFSINRVPGTDTMVQISSTGKLGLTSVYFDYENSDEGRSNMMLLPVYARHRQVYSSEDADSAGVSAAPMVSAGLKHTIALDSQGRVWVWGDNAYGQLGFDPDEMGVDKYIDSPRQITKFYKHNIEHPEIKETQLAEDGGPLRFVWVAAGDNFSLAVDIDGHVWAWGDDSYNQLGRGSETNYAYYEPRQVRVRVSRIGVLGDEIIHKEYIQENGLLDAYEERDKIIAVAAGSNHALALSSNGFVYGWGDDRFGQLGISGKNAKDGEYKYAQWVGKGKSPSQTNHMQEVASITAGGNSSAVLFTNGTLFSFGQNHKGQLGDGSQYTHYTAVKVGGGDGNVWTAGTRVQRPGVNPNDKGDVALNKVLAVEMGTAHAVAIALNVTMDESKTAAEKNFSVTPGIYGWGDNTQEQIGAIGATRPNGRAVERQHTAPIQVMLSGARQVAAGFQNSLTLVEDP